MTNLLLKVIFLSMSKINTELLRDISLLEKSKLSQEISLETRTQIIEKAQREITDLKTAVTQNLFFDAPIAKAEAEAVFDGFNAVANGMEDQSAFERIEHIPKDSIFQPWKSLVYALRSFYHGDTASMLSSLDKIKENTAPALLKPILRQAAGEEMPLTPRELKILNSIMRKKEESSSDVEKIKECHNAGYFEMLPSLMADYADQNRERGEVFLQSITLRCFDSLQEETPLSYSAIKKFFLVVGEFDAFRLAAVSSLKFYTEQAIFYWIEAANALLEYATSQQWETMQSLLQIIEEVWQCINSEYQLTDDYQSLLLDKIVELKQKTISLFGEVCPFYNDLMTNNTLETIMKRFSFKELGETTSIDIFSEQQPAEMPPSLKECSPRQKEEKHYKQLEFAF